MPSILGHLALNDPMWFLMMLQISSRCLVSGGADGHIRVWDTKLPRYTLRDDDDIIRMEVVDNRNGQNWPVTYSQIKGLVE